MTNILHTTRIEMLFNVMLLCNDENEDGTF